MAEADEKETGLPRLSEDVRGTDAQQPGVGVPGLAPPSYNDFNAGNPFAPGGDVAAMMESEAPPWWAISDDEAPRYDLFLGGGLSEAASSERTAPGEDIGMTTPVGEPNPGTGGISSRPVDPTLPQSIYSLGVQYWEMDPSTRAVWQQRMIDAGFLGEDAVVAWGRPNPDNSDYQAWLSLAKASARLSVPMSELVGDMAAHRVPDEGEKGPRRSDTVLTNPADIRRIAEAVGVELMGRAPDDGEVARAISAVHGSERSAGQAAGDASQIEGGGSTRTAAASPQTAVADAIEAAAPEEVRAHDTANAFADFLSMLGPAGGQG